MKEFVKFLVLGVLILGLQSCRFSNKPGSSRVKFNPFDRNVRNVALVVGSPNDLEGVARDVQNVSQVLRDPAIGYEVVVINNATADQILSKAQEIGQGLSPTSTVFFYYSGHGSDDGTLISQGHVGFHMSSVAKRIAQGYGRGKFKRFIAVMDSCYSGQNVNGDDAMFLAGATTKVKKSDQQMLQSAIGFMSSEIRPRADAELPFEQALILSAAQKNQLADDMGAGIGGAFTASWMSVMKSKLGQSGGATIQSILDETKRMTESNNGGNHSPAWKAMPESMLSEPLGFSGGGPSPGPGSLASDIFVAYGDASDGAMVFVSTPASVAVGSVDLCKGDKVACFSGSGQRLMEFVPATDLKLNFRSVFRGERNITPVDGETLTVVLRKNDGTALEARSYSVRRK